MEGQEEKKERKKLIFQQTFFVNFAGNERRLIVL